MAMASGVAKAMWRLNIGEKIIIITGSVISHGSAIMGKSAARAAEIMVMQMAWRQCVMAWQSKIWRRNEKWRMAQHGESAKRQSAMAAHGRQHEMASKRKA